MGTTDSHNTLNTSASAHPKMGWALVDVVCSINRGIPRLTLGGEGAERGADQVGDGGRLGDHHDV